MPHPSERDRAAQARRDAEYAAMIRRLQAEEQARRTGRTVEQVLAGWDAEDAARPTADELRRRHDAAIAAVRDAADAMQGLHDVAGAAAAADAMEAAIARIRRAAGGAPDADEGVLAERFRVASDMRGETIHYLELDATDAVTREARMEFYWTRAYEIYVHDMRRWWHPATGTSTDMTQAERRAVVARVVAWARREQGVALHVRDADW